LVGAEFFGNYYTGGPRAVARRRPGCDRGRGRKRGL